MYKVLITDDEKYVRLFLRKSIDWSVYGFEVIGEARNGLEALEQLEALLPDVLITDMDMPGMDGIQLIEEASMRFPAMRCVVLSGYKDYKYIRTAVQNNVFDYLLKPVKTDELIAMLQKLYSSMRQSDTQRLHQEKELLDLKKERFLIDLLTNNHIEINVDEKALEFGIGCEYNYYAVIYLVLDNDNETANIETYYGKPMLRFLIKNITNEVFANAGFTLNLLNIENNIAGVVRSSCLDDTENHLPLIPVCEQAIDMVQKFLQISLSIALGHSVEDLSNIRDSYLSALNALNLRPLYGNRAVLSYHNTPIAINRGLLTRPMENAFVQRLHSVDQKGIEDVLDTLLNNIKETKAPDVFAIKTLYNHIVSLILKTLYEEGIVPSSINLYEDTMYHTFQTFSSFSNMIDTLKRFAASAIVAIAGTAGASSCYIAQAKNYIQKHIANDFSISDIASTIFLTPNYLCTLFKNEVGITLNDYITQTRIDKAIELLTTQTLTINELCKMVGYSSAKYFRQVFKKVTGCTPSDYKKRQP